MVQLTTPLPADVINLMRRTMHLVNILYWQPAPKKGSRGGKAMAKRPAGRRQNPPRTERPDPTESGEESMTVDDQEMQIPSDSHVVSSHRSRPRWLAGADLETRMAYGRALMSGHGMLHFLSCSKPYTLKPSLPRP